MGVVTPVLVGCVRQGETIVNHPQQDQPGSLTLKFHTVLADNPIEALLSVPPELRAFIKPGWPLFLLSHTCQSGSSLCI